MKKCFFIVLIFFFTNAEARAQQFALFNTKTLFDSFENPAQKSFTLDSSRQYASNFLLPYLDLSSLNNSNSDKAIATLVKNGFTLNRNGAFTSPATLREDVNIYLLNFRLFAYHKYHSEMGFSWQIRSQTEIDYDDKTSLGYFETFNKFSTIPRINVFNNNGKLQTYHQISFNYRENYTKNWSLGVKISLLSGIGYSNFNASKSMATLNSGTEQLNVQMQGSYKINYPEDNDITPGKLLPFKNLGAAISLGTTYYTKSGIFLMANVKDLGFINWGKKKSVIGNIDIDKNFDKVSNEAELYRAMYEIGKENGEQKSFATKTNAKADFLISKTFGPFVPSLIISKNLWNKYGEIALVNTIKSGTFSISATPNYTTDKTFKLGVQGMIQTPNFEMFLGTNNLIKTYYTSADLIRNNENLGTGYNRGSVYLGMAFKIGYVVEHPQNMSWMPGVKNNNERKSVFGSFFNLFKKKKN